jgi:hypothetical protein
MVDTFAEVLAVMVLKLNNDLLVTEGLAITKH